MKERDWVKDIVVIGAGGAGRETCEIIKRMELSSRDVRLLGMLDDNIELHGREFNDVKVLGDLEWIKTHKGKVYFVVGIGDPNTKRNVTVRALAKGYIPTNVIDPSVIFFSKVKLGTGIIMNAGSCIMANVIIEDNVHINLMCSIGHDAILGRYSTVSPGCNLSGFTILDDGVFLGSNVATFPATTLGKWSKVGAGSVVAKDLEPFTVNIGSPTKIIKRL